MPDKFITLIEIPKRYFEMSPCVWAQLGLQVRVLEKGV